MRPKDDTAPAMALCDLMAPEDVLAGLDTPAKPELLRDLARLASDRLGIAADTVVGMLGKRESLGSTGIGNGVAVPHATIAGLGKPFVLCARLNKAIAFDAIDEKPVDIVFMVLAPAGQASTHLNVLSAIARKARSADWLAAVRSADSSKRIFDLLRDPVA